MNRGAAGAVQAQISTLPLRPLRLRGEKKEHRNVSVPPLFVRQQILTAPYPFRRRAIPMSPARPIRTSTTLLGSGTALTAAFGPFGLRPCS